MFQKFNLFNNLWEKKPPSPADAVVIEKEGWLYKRGENFNHWRKRYFYLFNDGTLLGFRGKQDDPLNAEWLNNFTVKDCEFFTAFTPKPFTFVLRAFQWNRVIKRTFYVDYDYDQEREKRRDPCQERDDWLSAIRRVRDSLNEPNKRVNGAGPFPSHDEIRNRIQEAARRPRSKEIKLLNGNEPGFTADDKKLFNKFEARETTQEAHSGKTKVTFANFEFLKVLRKGSFGKVVLCREKETSKLYALKILNKQAIVRENDVDQALAENRGLQRISHFSIMSLNCYFQSNDRLCFVTEYLSCGDLLFHLQQEKIKCFSEERTKFYGADIVSAIGYLHENGIIYKDLRLENVLLAADGHVKIVDFGLCKEEITYGWTTGTFSGPPEYLAPEVVKDEPYGFAVDWWTLGVVMYQMLTGRLPFYNEDQDILYKLIKEEKVDIPPYLSMEARVLLGRLLQKNPRHRVGDGPGDSKEVMNELFFKWEKIENKPKHYLPPLPQAESDTEAYYFDTVFTGQSVEFTAPDRREITEFFPNHPNNDLDYEILSYQQMPSKLPPAAMAP